MLVAEHLNFDVAGIDDEFFDEYPVVAERRLGFRLGEAKAFGDLRGRMRDPHPLAAAAGRGLDHHGVSDRVGDLHRVPFVRDDAKVARHSRDIGLRGSLLGFDLVAHGGDSARVRSDEDDTGFAQHARECFALGQEAVARMHGLRAGLSAGLDDLLHHEIAFGCGRRPDQNRLIGHFDVECVAVGLGIDGHGLYSHAAGSLDDPAGDLAAICDQNSFEHVLAYLQPLGGGSSPAIWHAGTDVTIPSYSKTGRRQRYPVSRPLACQLWMATDVPDDSLFGSRPALSILRIYGLVPRRRADRRGLLADLSSVVQAIWLASAE